MTVFYSRHNSLHDPGAGKSTITSWLRGLARRAASRAGAALAIVHRAVVPAKTRRLQRELMFHADPENDAARFPQRPLILDDRWDF